MNDEMASRIIEEFGLEAFLRLESGGEKGQPTWQPIATAPKDTEVLVWGPGWSSVGMATNYGGRWFDGDYEYEAQHRPPTHWQPLPAPPEVEP